jgi:large subunit ribosomal protein L24
MKLKKGDHVVVLSGKHRGETSEILTVLPSKNAVILNSLNIAKKHTSTASTQAKGRRNLQQAGIIDKYMPMAASAVAVLCSKHGGPARIGYREENGKKVRFCHKCGEKL